MTDFEELAAAYRHRQTAPLCLLIYATAIVFFVTAWVLWNQSEVAWIMLACGLLMLPTAASIHYLEVVGDREMLRVRFGPLPLFRRSVIYQEIETVEVSRTGLIDGWGIHYSAGGWTWNLWGRHCVVLHLRNGLFRVGTDDPAGLVAFLQSRVARPVR